jgi:hypothetical protein
MRSKDMEKIIHEYSKQILKKFNWSETDSSKLLQVQILMTMAFQEIINQWGFEFLKLEDSDIDKEVRDDLQNVLLHFRLWDNKNRMGMDRD